MDRGELLPGQRGGRSGLQIGTDDPAAGGSGRARRRGCRGWHLGREAGAGAGAGRTACRR